MTYSEFLKLVRMFNYGCGPEKVTGVRQPQIVTFITLSYVNTPKTSGREAASFHYHKNLSKQIIVIIRLANLQLAYVFQCIS